MQSGALGRIISAVTRRATFQAPPSVAEERGWPAEGTTVPARFPQATALFVNAEWSLRPNLFRPSPGVPPSKRLPAWPRRGVGPRRGRLAPPRLPQAPALCLTAAARLTPDAIAASPAMPA